MEHVRRFRTPILIGAGTIVLALIIFVAVISPEGKKLSSLNAQQTQLTSQQTQLTSEIAMLKREKAQMAGNCKKLTNDIAEIPGTPDVDNFLRQVTALAVASGDPNTPSISVTQAPSGAASTPSAGAGATGGATSAVAVTFTLNGTYGQMSAFVHGLDKFPRLFTVSTITIGGGPAAQGGAPVDANTPAYTLTLSGDIYYSLGRQDVCSGALPSGGSATTTAATTGS
jgi:Tfp pilus assembly protein PilO